MLKVVGCTLPFPGLIFLSLWETRGCKDAMQEFLYILTSIGRVLVVVGGWEDNVLVCVFSDLQTLLKLGLPSLINCISPCKCGVDACSIRHQTQVIFHRSLYKEKQRTHRIESDNAARNLLPRHPLIIPQRARHISRQALQHAGLVKAQRWCIPHAGMTSHSGHLHLRYQLSSHFAWWCVPTLESWPPNLNPIDIQNQQGICQDLVAWGSKLWHHNIWVTMTERQDCVFFVETVFSSSWTAGQYSTVPSEFLGYSAQRFEATEQPNCRCLHHSDQCYSVSVVT